MPVKLVIYSMPAKYSLNNVVPGSTIKFWNMCGRGWQRTDNRGMGLRFTILFIHPRSSLLTCKTKLFIFTCKIFILFAQAYPPLDPPATFWVVKIPHTGDTESLDVSKNVMCHISCVICHLSHGTFHLTITWCSYRKLAAMKVPAGLVMWLQKVWWSIEF